MEVIKYERIPIPPVLLRTYCDEVTLDDIAVNADMEALLARLYACNARNNADKKKISER